MFFYRRFVPGLAINSYLVGDRKTKKCAVIDPVRDVEEYVTIAEREGFIITDILETHVHADYVSGSLELKHWLKRKPTIHCSGMGGKEWTPRYTDRIVKDGDEVVLGEVFLRAVHTPGHTPEHVMWALFDKGSSRDTPLLLLTGDFLFVGGVGRPDLLGEEACRELARQLYQSVFKVLPQFPDSVEIFPAHGAGSFCGKAIASRPSSTLGEEWQQNPALRKASEEEWIENLLHEMPRAPSYFQRLKEVNVKGAAILGKNLPGQREISAQEAFKRISETDVLVVDIRPKETFAQGHIAGAISLPFGAAFSSWAAWLLPHDRPMIIVSETAEVVREVVIHLIRIGLDDVQGYLGGDVAEWQRVGFSTLTLETISVAELEEKRRKGKASPVILDVRTEVEWQGGHIPGACHIPLGSLKERFSEVEKGRSLVTICGSGARSSAAASFLKREGYLLVSNVLGGMAAWREAQLPVHSEAK